MSDRSTTDESAEISDSSSGSMTDNEKDHKKNLKKLREEASRLKKQVMAARIENPRGSFCFYIPPSQMKRLTTCETVKAAIQLGHPAKASEEAAKLANSVVTSSIGLFCILCSIKKVGDIVSFLEAGISDTDLPLLRGTDSGFDLRCKGGQELNWLKSWKSEKKEDFDRHQWWMLAPFFSVGKHHDVGHNAALPFIPLSQQQEKHKSPSGGAYSEVSFVQIHEEYHDFWSICVFRDRNEVKVAIKKLRVSDEREFNKELRVLRVLGYAEPHDHLVQLLGSYKYRENFHLMFPCANSNLRAYWDKKKPVFDQETVLWMLRQMKGLASALDRVHNFRAPIALTVDGDRKMTRDNKMLAVKAGEEWFGRHGDLKPENILWHQETPQSKNGKGTLKIADFGLGRFHGRETRTHAAGYHIFSSPTYEPPECHVHLVVSRAYDIWSLGALFLEFVTWLLLGAEAIDQFSAKRVEESSILLKEGSIKDDYFWTLKIDNGERKAEMRKGVIEWVNKLRADEHCSQLIYDLLDLFMGSMLRIKPEDRIRSGGLHESLQKLLCKAERDEQYLLRRR